MPAKLDKTVALFELQKKRREEEELKALCQERKQVTMTNQTNGKGKDVVQGGRATIVHRADLLYTQTKKLLINFGALFVKQFRYSD